MFKDVYKGVLGEKAAQYQTIGFLISSACAEVIADVMLCPMEAVSYNPTAICDAIASFLFMIDVLMFSLFPQTVEGPHADL